VLKLFVVSFSFKRGGAAIAANNFCKLLTNESALELEKISQDKFELGQFIKRLISHGLSKLQISSNSIKHSLNLFSYRPVLRAFRNNRKGIFHFHWINNDTLSILDFNRIPAYSIITLHDEWFYLGSEHYYNLTDEAQDFSVGYKLWKRGIFGIHWNYLIWKTKYKTLPKRKDLIFTVPSKWMMERAKSSLILCDSEVRIMPNPIDTMIFTPSSAEKVKDFKAAHFIRDDAFVISFGAIDGKRNHIKGSDLLQGAIDELVKILPSEVLKNLVLLNFGGTKANQSYPSGIIEISLGHIKKQEKIALIYSSSDILVVPSLVESFGQVAAESLSCETPVVCFDTSGLRDIVDHLENGLYAEDLSSESLSKSLIQMINLTPADRKEMGKNGRLKVIQKFSKPVVKINYLELLHEQAQKLRAL
jgi:glycosyltransferase involved in cell wall biosynthesis